MSKNNTIVFDFEGFETDINGKITFAGIMAQNMDFITRFWHAEATLRQYYKEYRTLILPRVNNIAFTKLTKDKIEEILEDIYKELGGTFVLSQERKNHFLHLFKVVTAAGAVAGVCEDVLWTPTDYDLKQGLEEYLANSQTRRKSLTPKEEKQVAEDILLDHTQSGEKMGLAMMFSAGLRNQEACGLNYSDIIRIHGNPDFSIIIIHDTTHQKSSQLKDGGKTFNAPRVIPITGRAHFLIERRRKLLQDLIDAGEIDVKCVDDLPVVCHGSNYTSRCRSDDLSNAAWTVFSKIVTLKHTLFDVQRALDSNIEISEEGENNATAYLLRRNYATHLYILFDDIEDIEYLMGHKLETTHSKHLAINEDNLRRLAKRLMLRPIINDIPDDSSILIDSEFSGIRHSEHPIVITGNSTKETVVFVQSADNNPIAITTEGRNRSKVTFSAVPLVDKETVNRISMIDYYWKEYRRYTLDDDSDSNNNSCDNAGIMNDADEEFEADRDGSREGSHDSGGDFSDDSAERHETDIEKSYDTAAEDPIDENNEIFEDFGSIEE